jgi:hypothetical protein
MGGVSTKKHEWVGYMNEVPPFAGRRFHPRCIVRYVAAGMLPMI